MLMHFLAGPEPTTDRFIAVMYDENDGTIPGNALVRIEILALIS